MPLMEDCPLLGIESRFGVEFDSMADTISFV